MPSCLIWKHPIGEVVGHVARFAHVAFFLYMQHENLFRISALWYDTSGSFTLRLLLCILQCFGHSLRKGVYKGWSTWSVRNARCGPYTWSTNRPGVNGFYISSTMTRSLFLWALPCIAAFLTCRAVEPATADTNATTVPPASSPVPTRPRIPLYIGGFFAFPRDKIFGALPYTAQTAVDHINNLTGILDGYELRMRWRLTDVSTWRWMTQVSVTFLSNPLSTIKP